MRCASGACIRPHTVLATLRLLETSWEGTTWVFTFMPMILSCTCLSIPVMAKWRPQQPLKLKPVLVRTMCCNKLKLNSDKSELLFICSCYWPRPLLTSLKISTSVVQSSASARNLGVVFDNSLTFEKHVSAICKSALYHPRRIAKIKSYLTEESTIGIFHAFMTCRLDNGNAPLYRLPKYQIQRLQSVQNCTASLVKLLSKFDHISPLLFELYWLPVEHRILFKILLLVFNSLNNLAPTYTSNLLTQYSPSLSLRSSNQFLLVVPRSIQKTYGDRAFAVAGPSLWNALPIHMRQPGISLGTFKESLNTYLFKKAFL